MEEAESSEQCGLWVASLRIVGAFANVVVDVVVDVVVVVVVDDKYLLLRSGR